MIEVTTAPWQRITWVLSEQIARFEDEKYGTEHVQAAMDKILYGSAYAEKAPVKDKIFELEKRAAVYLAYDQLMVARGYRGNIEIDSPAKRLEIFASHIADIKRYSRSNPDQFRLMFLQTMCKGNCLFLGREVLDRDFTFFAHCPLFDSFVQKDVYKPITEQDTHKVRLLMMARGSFKSVGDGIDCVQWLVCFRDMRIMLLCATTPLARDFVGELKGYFTPSDLDEPDSYTPFQTLFAADVRTEEGDGKTAPTVSFIPTNAGKETQFISPAMKTGDRKAKEVSVWASGLNSGKTGKHCLLIKCDDCVTELNSENQQLVLKTINRINQARKLLDPGGFLDDIGTFYNIADYHNHLRTTEPDLISLIRPARSLRKDAMGATAIERGKSQNELTPADQTLAFPVDKSGRPKLTWKFLEAAERGDPLNFPSQYLLDPRGNRPVSFPEELLQRRIISRDRMPQTFQRFILGDLADTISNFSDWSVLAVLEVDDNGRGYITDIVRGKFLPSDLCYQIALLNHSVSPSSVLLEDAKGASKLTNDILRAAKDMGDANVPLVWIPVDNRKGSKGIRIGRLEMMLRDGRLFFLNSIPCLEELIQEFRDFGLAPNDDLPDAKAHSQRVLSDLRPAPVDLVAQGRAEEIIRNKEFHERIFQESPETYMDATPIQPLPEVGGNDQPDDLYDPFGIPGFNGSKAA